MARVRDIDIPSLFKTGIDLVFDIQEARRRGKSHTLLLEQLRLTNEGLVQSNEQGKAEYLEREASMQPGQEEETTIGGTFFDPRKVVTQEAKDPGYRRQAITDVAKTREFELAKSQEEADKYTGTTGTGFEKLWAKEDKTGKYTLDEMRAFEAEYNKSLRAELGAEEFERLKDVAEFEKQLTTPEVAEEGHILFPDGKLDRTAVYTGFIQLFGRSPGDIYYSPVEQGGGQVNAEAMASRYARETAATYSDEQYDYGTIYKAIYNYIVSLFGEGLQISEDLPGVELTPSKDTVQKKAPVTQDTISGVQSSGVKKFFQGLSVPTFRIRGRKLP